MDGPRDPFDDLADLFLTPEEEFGAAPSAESSAAADAMRRDGTLPAVTVAVAGHLPVSAGLWLAQLSDRLARDQGPTGLVRFVAGQVHVEVFRAGRSGEPAEPLDLRDALELATRLARRWIVVPEASASPGQVIRAGRDGVLLLTGADEAAVVAAYRLIKALAEEAMVEGRAIPPISMGVLGAGDVQVADAMTKLNRTSEAFLAMGLPLTLAMPRMEPLESTLRFMLPASRTVTFEDVPALLRELIQATPPASKTRAAPTPPEPREPAGSGGDPWPFALPPQAAEHAEPPAEPREPEIETAAAGESLDEPVTTPVQNSAASLRRLVAGRAGEWASMGQGAFAEPSVPSEAAKLPPTPVDGFVRASMLGGASHEDRAEIEHRGLPSPLLPRFESLSPLPIACPYHPSVELGVDDAGRLHLVAPLDRLIEVEATAAWAADHAAMLRLACPGIEAGDPSDLRIDLVTSRARDAMPLAHSRIRLHLLASVSVGRERGWLMLPLNEAAECDSAETSEES
jgi:hypothetical protein